MKLLAYCFFLADILQKAVIILWLVILKFLLWFEDNNYWAFCLCMMCKMFHQFLTNITGNVIPALPLYLCEDYQSSMFQSRLTTTAKWWHTSFKFGQHWLVICLQSIIFEVASSPFKPHQKWKKYFKQQFCYWTWYCIIWWCWWWWWWQLWRF